ncbi:hypothetical protein SKTS_32550 [Sulfurimicrobium lacus]|uniref:Uncharacterized protein n=1 Tax=Sulfurimicrobium lacus TaxID=2715678 RepID=A0A6F8VI33_9PROT|nr:hypothetical protein SKTS_32550 [Sulfurimicrobium lacus]
MRWDLLYQLKRWPDLLQQARDLPPDAPDAVRNYGLWRSAQALVALHQDDEARESLARLLWQGELDAAQSREARRLVIDTYFSQNRGDDAYLAILRFQQDFQPLSQSEIGGFVQGLALHGKAGEATAWLPQLRDSPLALFVGLHSGAVTPSMAAEQALATLKKSGDAGYWGVLAQAAALQQDAAGQAEAQENLLAAAQNANLPAALQTSAEKLWQSYHAYALALGNQRQLLLGDDTSWQELAEQLEQENPLAARALFANLVRQSADMTVRANAESHLTALLMRAGLVRTVFQLFADKPDLALSLLDDPSWLDNSALRRKVIFELAVQAKDRGEYGPATEYLLHLQERQP